MAHVDTKPEIHDLSLLSLLAAHELERLQRHEPSNGQYLSALRDHLAEEVPDADADIKCFAPSTVQLYRRAVREATNTDPPDFPALLKELNFLLQQLQAVSETVKAKKRKRTTLDLNKLLAFVISLHEQLLAQKQRLASNRGPNPFRV